MCVGDEPAVAQCKHQKLSSNYTKAAFPPSRTRENILEGIAAPETPVSTRFSARKIVNQTLFLEVVQFDLIEATRLKVTSASKLFSNTLSQSQGQPPAVCVENNPVFSGR